MKINEIKLGAILSYLTIALNTIIGLFYIPILLRSLGQSEYGLYMLIGSIVGYISVLDFGLHNAIYRFVSKYQSENNEYAQKTFLSTIFVIYSLIMLLVIVVGVILYNYIGVIFSSSIDLDNLHKARIMFAILVFNLAISLPLGAFQFILRGYGKFTLTNIVKIVRILLRTSIAILILFLGYKSVAIVVVDTVFNLLMGIIFLYYCVNKYQVKFSFKFFDKSLIKEIFSYSVYVFIIAIINQFFWKIGQVTLGVIDSTISVAIYALSLSLVSYYQQFGLAISGLFMPKVSKLVTNGSNNFELTNLMIKVGRLQFIILGFILILFFLFGKNFITLWAGEEYNETYIIVLMLFLSITIPMSQTIGGVILQVKNLQFFKTVNYSIMCVFNIFFAIYLGGLYGAFGVGLATAISVFVFQLIIMNIYYYYNLGINMKRFYIEVFNKTLLVLIFILILGSLFSYFPSKGWLGLMLKGLLISSIYLIFMLKYGFNKFERELIILPLRKTFGSFNK
jgi:O-antigen/teichoic acid export membrane protein